MSKIKNFFKNPRIQIALAIGFSIIVTAYFSKKVLPEPIGFLEKAIPPFIGAIYELILDKYKDSKIFTAWYWVVAILFTTALIIAIHFF